VPGKRKWAGGGVLGLGEKGKKKEREKGRWAGWAENKKRKKKWLCIFLKRTNTLKSNLNLGTQTQNERQAIKQCTAAWMQTKPNILI